MDEYRVAITKKMTVRNSRLYRSGDMLKREPFLNGELMQIAEHFYLTFTVHRQAAALPAYNPPHNWHLAAPFHLQGKPALCQS